MEKENKWKWIKRLPPLICALFIVLCTVVFAVPAQAASGGSVNMPQYYTQLQFDSFVAKNARNNTLWSVDWGIRESMGQNYSYDYSSILGNSAFGYTAAVFNSVTDANGNLRKFYEVYTSHDLSSLANVMLYSKQMFIYVPQLVNMPYYFAFGMDILQEYELEISFNLVTIVDDGTDYVSTSQYITERFQNQYDEFLDLNQCMYEALQQSVEPLTNIVYCTDVKFTFSNIGKEYEDLGTTMITTVITYSNGTPNTMASYMNQFDLDITVEEVRYPTDLTDWLGKAVSGFFSAEILPGISFGAIAAAVFGVLIVWFILHLFM